MECWNHLQLMYLNIIFIAEKFENLIYFHITLNVEIEIENIYQEEYTQTEFEGRRWGNLLVLKQKFSKTLPV